jgi:hypothetical protein
MSWLKMHFQKIVDGRCFKNKNKIFFLNKVYFPNVATGYILNPFLSIP